jgi:uncharacterized protein YutE (UPF0331/DUF86 family)
LACTDEITANYDSKAELDFNNRLIAKFRLQRGSSFWGRGFEAIPERVLYPSKDKMNNICSELKEELGSELEPSRVGRFLQEWTKVENIVLTAARKRQQKVYSMREAIGVLSRSKHFPRQRLEELRTLRNLIVHEPSRVTPQNLAFALDSVKELEDQMKMLDL